jgi:DNA-binding CsgD family transcriptional regulator
MSKLSPREQQLLDAIKSGADGYVTSKEIALQCGVATKTIGGLVENLRNKLGPGCAIRARRGLGGGYRYVSRA